VKQESPMGDGNKVAELQVEQMLGPEQVRQF